MISQVKTLFFFTLKSLSNKVKSAYEPIVAHQAGAYLSFSSMK